MMATNTHLLNDLLQGEIAATETYQQAVDKARNDSRNFRLEAIHAEHRAAANALRMHVREGGGDPVRSSGVWGAFAKTIEGAAKLFGKTAALKALKEGEEHGIRTYEDALEDDSLAPECKSLIESTLLPQTRDHVRVLDELMKAKKVASN